MNEILAYLVALILTPLGIPLGYYIAHHTSEELRQLKKYVLFGKKLIFILGILSIPIIFIFGKEFILITISLVFLYLLIKGTEIFSRDKKYWTK